ncbi:hypothetical protein HK099_007857 [Clydaea vesicula]|uniref:Transmembrane protein n=1 Tax=Clydaea vesicula TaxID=447962 RepID=A0AAD5Y229_9FUNG|nr:hypothetical protein HK099_007857 [Clydaea vesicula]
MASRPFDNENEVTEHYYPELYMPQQKNQKQAGAYQQYYTNQIYSNYNHHPFFVSEQPFSSNFQPLLKPSFGNEQIYLPTPLSYSNNSGNSKYANNRYQALEHSAAANYIVRPVNYLDDVNKRKRSDASDIELINQKSRLKNGKLRIGKLQKKTTNRYCCGCFGHRRSCCCFWLWFLIAILAGLGAAVFLLFPRLPDIQVNTPYINTNEPENFKTSGSVLDTSPDTPFTFTFKLYLDISVKSANYIDWDLKKVDVEGKLQNLDDSVNKNIVGKGTKENVKIKKFSTTNLTMPIEISYFFNEKITNALNDPGMQLILSNCAFIPGTEKKDFKLSYQVLIDFPLVSWTGYTPTISGITNFPCPISETDFTSRFGPLIGMVFNDKNNL